MSHGCLDQVQIPDPEDTNQSLVSWDLEFELGKTLGQLAMWDQGSADMSSALWRAISVPCVTKAGEGDSQG